MCYTMIYRSVTTVEGVLSLLHASNTKVVKLYTSILRHFLFYSQKCDTKQDTQVVLVQISFISRLKEMSINYHRTILVYDNCHGISIINMRALSNGHVAELSASDRLRLCIHVACQQSDLFIPSMHARLREIVRLLASHSR